MAVAVIQDWVEPETERSTRNYDAISERVMAGGPPDGLHMHSAGFTGNGFRIIEVWETREDFDRFMRERLGPIIGELDPGGAEPAVTAYELHNLVVP